MKDAIKLFGKHTLVYGIGSALSAIASFLLIPIYTKVLSVSDYGVLELLNRTSDVVLLIVFMGIRQAYIRFYFERKDEEWKKTVTATTLLVVGISCLLAAAFFFPLAPWISETLLGGHVSPDLLRLLFMWIPGECVYTVGMACLQVQMKSWLFLLCSAARLALVISSNLYLLYVMQEGVWGAMVTNIWVTIFFGCLFAFFLFRWTGLAFSAALAKQLLSFGLPILPALFFAYIINNADRFFLMKYATMESVGVYSLAFKLGMFGTLLVLEPFSRMWAPILFDNYQSEGGDRLIGDVFILVAGVLATTALVSSFFAPVLIPLLTTAAYGEAYRLLPVLAAAACFYSLTCLADAGILIAKKTKIKPLIAGSCAVLSVALNYLLTPRFGAWGAAFSLLATFVAMFVLNHTISRRYFRMAISRRKIAALVGASAISFSLWLALQGLGEDPLSRFAQGMVALAAYAVVLWFGGFVSLQDRTQLKRMSARFLGKT